MQYLKQNLSARLKVILLTQVPPFQQLLYALRRFMDSFAFVSFSNETGWMTWFSLTFQTIFPAFSLCIRLLRAQKLPIKCDAHTTAHLQPHRNTARLQTHHAAHHAHTHIARTPDHSHAAHTHTQRHTSPTAHALQTPHTRNCTHNLHTTNGHTTHAKHTHTRTHNAHTHDQTLHLLGV